MKYFGKVKVAPHIPEKLRGIKDIAYNLWWSWDTEAKLLFKSMDNELWEKSGRNPVIFLKTISQSCLDELALNKEFTSFYDKIYDRFKKYISAEKTWFNKRYGNKMKGRIAYFSAEFGLHESLPIYSGGLGILAGDHNKSASDLGLPFIGVGLLYRNGYFKQEIDPYGIQISSSENLRFRNLPVIQVKNEEGEPLLVEVILSERKVYARIWRINVGRNSIILLDTDFEKNSPEDRKLTEYLYGGDSEMRISQEILLGIGGVRALKLINEEPVVWHMNEGHSVFLGLERIRMLVKEHNIDFYSALEAVRANTIFTTHTPVAAGNDAFPITLKDKYFRKYWEEVGITRHQFMDLGLQVLPEGHEIFSLTFLAFNLAGRSNGVSKLHGEVSRNIWSGLWPNIPKEEIPITSITNGIHTGSWLSENFAELYDRYLPKQWRDYISHKEIWNDAINIDDRDLWETKLNSKKRLSRFLSNSLKKQCLRHERSISDRELENILNPNALIIGFARRFATYKRATLIFKNKERILKILSNHERPVQLVFAGKAHPADRPGQELLKEIYNISKSPEFFGKVFLLENYNIKMAKYLVQGVDVWLNNPRKPLEASGTSGQKVPVNGGLNCSILDGWWCEGYNKKNGWAIGKHNTATDVGLQDRNDAESLYEILEDRLIPIFYERNEQGLPIKWISMMKESMRSIIPEFSTDRMVKDYVNKLYIPAYETGKKFSENNFSLSKEISKWKTRVYKGFKNTKLLPADKEDVRYNLSVHDTERVSVKCFINDLKPDDIRVEAVLGMLDKNEEWYNISAFPLEAIKQDGDYWIFSGEIKPEDRGDYLLTFRIIPYNKDFINKHEMRIIKWYGESL